MTRKLNDYLALTEERRFEIEKQVDELIQSTMFAPGLPMPRVPGEMLVDASNHIQACDNRARNMFRIVEALTNLADEMAAAAKAAEDQDQVAGVPCRYVADQLRAAFDEATQAVGTE